MDNAYYIRTYGISLQQYNDIKEEQKFRCKICRRHESMLNTELIVDHNHDTGIVRGLICKSCNLNISLMGDSDEAFISLQDEMHRKYFTRIG